MSSINRITLIGTVGNEPDARVTNSGDPMLRFTVVADRPGLDGMSSVQDYIPVIAWRQVAEKRDEIVKGAVVLIDGRIVTRSFDDNDGKRKWVTEVDAREIRVFGSPGTAGSVAEVEKPKMERVPIDQVGISDFDFGEPVPSSPSMSKIASYASGPKFDADLDEDIPF